MTTIVVKDGVIAGDSATVVNSGTRCEMIVHRSKLRVSPCRSLAIGTTGEVLTDSGFEKLVRFTLSAIGVMQEQGSTSVDVTELSRDISALILTSDGHYVLDNQRFSKDVEGVGMAVGSGSDFALAGLVGGLGAVECVALAIRHDNLTGGEIFSILASDLAPIQEHVK